MNRIRILTAVVLWSLSISTFAGTANTILCKEPADTLPQGVQEALKSTVTIHSVIALKKENLDDKTNAITTVGSGYIHSSEGHVVMSGHRIRPYLENKHPSRHTVILHDCRSFEATVVAVGGDQYIGTDAVALKINAPPNDLVPIEQTKTLESHLEVYVLGSPFGWMNTVYEGSLTRKDWNTNPDTVYAYIRLLDGISGGPLVTREGKMLGSAQGHGQVTFAEAEMYVSFFVSNRKLNAFLSDNNL